ncbi:MAG: hypothetical protein IPG61_10275 [bacterium]|nr:hypothetical protein [bacterium]
MISLELQGAPQPNVIVTRSAQTPTGAWARLEEAVARGITGGDHYHMIVRVEVMLANLEVLRDVQRMFRAEVTFGPAMLARLRLLADDRVQRTAALDRVPELDTAISSTFARGGVSPQPQAIST